MKRTNNNNNMSWEATVLAILGAILLITLISKLLKDLSSGRGTSIVSEEGSAILADETKSKAVLKEIDKFHKTGKWEEVTH